MANPTTNYGFILPTSSDLVKDLPADFDVALQGVDTRLKALQPGTTLGDIAYSSATANTNTRLPIGTNGQVLSISSGVPAWTTTADVTPLTTKGDLFTFTTVDARLGVGTKDQLLTVDSATATGLKYSAGDWLTWTPTINNLSIGNGTISARYQQISKTVMFSIKVTFGSTTTISGSPNIVMTPGSSVSDAVFSVNILDAGTARYAAQGIMQAGGTNLFLDLIDTTSSRALLTSFSSTSPFTWATGDLFTVSGSYEVA